MVMVKFVIATKICYKEMGFKAGCFVGFLKNLPIERVMLMNRFVI